MKSSINTIYQTFGSIELYTNVEEKAVILLYLAVKNHSFSDGNKRILYDSDGCKRIENNALASITLLIAEIDVSEKDMMMKVIVNLIS